jgi:hypothetical protein
VVERSLKIVKLHNTYKACIDFLYLKIFAFCIKQSRLLISGACSDICFLKQPRQLFPNLGGGHDSIMVELPSTKTVECSEFLLEHVHAKIKLNFRS